MEKVNITINGDILINFNLPGDLFDDYDDDFFEDDEFEDEEAPENEEPDFPGLNISVSGLPSDVDRKAVEAVMEAAAEALKSVLEQTAERTDGGGRHERV